MPRMSRERSRGRGRAGARRALVRAVTLALFAALAPAAAAAAGGIGVGAHAPVIELSDLGGTAHRVAWGEGAPAATIVYFFDPLTSDCLLEMSFLDALYQRARDHGLAVYAIEARGRQPAEVGRSLERYCAVYRNPSFPVLADPAYRASRTYGVEATPVAFITESHGVVLNRVDGYSHADAVAIARRVEQLLRRERGTFSPLLREAGITEAEEREAEARIADATAARAAAPAARALGVGDRVPAMEFSGVAGRKGRWTWGDGTAAGARVVAFFAGLTLPSIEVLSWLDGLSRRGGDAGLQVLAVEAGGMDEAGLGAALEKYRRYNPEPSFPVVPDAGGRLAATFGPWEQLPQVYLVAPDGAVIYRAESFGAGEAEIMTGKIERSFALAGKPFPAARSGPSAAGGAEPPPIDEEAPSIRRQREQDAKFRSAVTQADALFVDWQFEEALKLYREALAIEPKDLHALVRAAQICERRADPAGALEYWERVLAVRPDHPEARNRVRELRPTR